MPVPACKGSRTYDPAHSFVASLSHRVRPQAFAYRDWETDVLPRLTPSYRLAGIESARRHFGVLEDSGAGVGADLPSDGKFSERKSLAGRSRGTYFFTTLALVCTAINPHSAGRHVADI